MKSKAEMTKEERIARLDVMVEKLISCLSTEGSELRFEINEALECTNLLTEEDKAKDWRF